MRKAADSGPQGGALRSTRMLHPLLESKLRRPPRREGWVDRGRLLDQLEAAATRPVTLIAAPAGFGKTTLLVQWVEGRRSSSGTAWVALDAGDNDPVRLWTHIGTALERAGCDLGRSAARLVSAASDDITLDLLPRLITALASVPEDFVLLLDDFHFVRERACHEQIEFLIEHLPPQAHLVVATRADPGLRLGRLRASGRLGELRAADLAFSPDEATSLLAIERVQLTLEAVKDLVHRTEGWPAGLYLATLSLSGQADPDEFVRQFSGHNRFVGDYMSEEVIGRLSEPVRELITTVSILDLLSPPLCDHVAQTTTAAAILRELERTNMFLVALDEDHRWYRLHHLFATAARAQLEIEQPERIPALHARAGAWFRDHGHVEEAIEHLLAAGHMNDAAVLVQANWLTYVSAGRAATVEGWLRALGPPSVAADPAAGVTAAWLAATSGDRQGLARHLEALEGFRNHGPLPDGTRSVESAIAMIEGIFGFGGPVAMTTAAHRAVELEHDGRSPWYSVALVGLGHATYVAGDLDRAAQLFARATGNSAALAIIRVLGLGAHSLAAEEAGDSVNARELAEDAMAIVEGGGLHGVPQASVAFTALALARMNEGDLAGSLAAVEHGLAVRRRNPALSPWPTMHHLVVAARVSSRAGNLPQARQLLAEAEELMDRFPHGMEAMRTRALAVRQELSAPPPSLVGEPLTDRELDVLALLRGSMSLNEIASQLFVSRNTVKSHTRALYRKLGATSRDDAVRIARERALM